MTMKQIEINVPEAVVPYANVEGKERFCLEMP